jgi:hypothetical protein
MSKVFSAHAVSVDGYISGRTPDGDEEFGRRSTPMLDPDVRRVLDGTSIAHLATYPRGQERVVAVIEPERQIVGVG